MRRIGLPCTAWLLAAAVAWTILPTSWAAPPDELATSASPADRKIDDDPEVVLERGLGLERGRNWAAAIETYREALIVSRVTREMICLMEGRHVHPSTLYPGGTGTVATPQVFTDYLVRLMKFIKQERGSFNGVRSVVLTTLLGLQVTELNSLSPDRYSNIPTALLNIVEDLDRFLQHRDDGMAGTVDGIAIGRALVARRRRERNNLLGSSLGHGGHF